MNTQLPPIADAADVNALLDEARMPFAVKTAAITLAGAGLVVALWGVQNLTLIRWVAPWYLLPLALVAAGAAGIAVAAKLVRGRRWSLAAGIAVGAVLSVASIGFVVWSLLSGVFSPLGVLAVAGSITALVLVLVAGGPFRRLMVTRAKLRDAGYDLDL